MATHRMRAGRAAATTTPRTMLQRAGINLDLGLSPGLGLGRLQSATGPAGTRTKNDTTNHQRRVSTGLRRDMRSGSTSATQAPVSKVLLLRQDLAPHMTAARRSWMHTAPTVNQIATASAKVGTHGPSQRMTGMGLTMSRMCQWVCSLARCAH
jgi:hypothetical protein